MGGSKLFAYQDLLGSTLVLTDSTPATKRTYAYDLWGKLTGGSDPGTLGGRDRARWKGALWFGEETEIYYMRARWYDPGTGRFLSEDPIGLDGGINPSVFAGDDPVNGSDPSGLECIYTWVPEAWSTSSTGTRYEPGYFKPNCRSHPAGGTGPDGNELGVGLPQGRGRGSSAACVPGEFDWARLGKCVASSAADHYGLSGAALLSGALAIPIPKSMVPPFRSIGKPTTNLLSVLGHYVEVPVRRIAIRGLESSNLLRIVVRANPYVAGGLLAIDLAAIGYQSYQCYGAR